LAIGLGFNFLVRLGFSGYFINVLTDAILFIAVEEDLLSESSGRGRTW
jgi:hypothetical protein